MRSNPRTLKRQFAALLGSPPEGSGSPPLHPMEAALLAVAAVHLCMLPWALGAMHARAQVASLALAAAGFFLAALPRSVPLEKDSPAPPLRWPLARIHRFPVFWAGLATLAYVCVQGLNPAWRFQANADSWWLVPLNHVAWLPSGVEAPFERSNPWRALVVYGSVWLTVCSLWCGFFRRWSYRALFSILVANALLLAGLGLAEQLLGATKIFWSYLPSNRSFVSSFIYRNHAGCYFNLMVAVAGGLAWWHYIRARRALESPARSILFAFMAVCSGVMVIFSYSRMSIVLLLLFTAFAGCALAVSTLARFARARGRVDTVPLLATLVAFLAVCVITLNSSKVWDRFAGMVSDPLSSETAREQARSAATDMLGDRWLLGWGAACFRYEFPLYVQRYPDIYYSDIKGLKYWEHAHDDLLELPIELGAAGLAPLGACLGWLAWELCRRRFWSNPLSLALVLGCSLTVVHAAADFVFQNPAVLLTWAVMAAGALRWAQMDQPVPRRLPGT